MRKARGNHRTLPLEDGPGERIQGLGPGALSLWELLSLVLSDGEPVAEGSHPAKELLAAFGCLKELDRRSLPELARIKGVGHEKAVRVKAALELGRRLMREQGARRSRISCPEDVFNHLSPLFSGVKQEVFVVLLLNGQNELMKEIVVSKGGLMSSVIHPREVFREAIVESSAAIVLAHNHPSGNPNPSKEDHKVTQQLHQAGTLLGIEVFDHVIIGDGAFVSFKEMGSM
jgi:DNA repair protein RadC